LVEFHTDSVADFANPAGFGYLDWEVRGGERVKTLERVIGFQPHAFRRLPEPPEQQNGAKWRIVQLELVSLLKHDEPVAYVSDHLPRMKELREAPTRPLNAFERDALTQLEAGEDLVVQTLPNTLQMFGSLRALWQCTNCHQVQKGTLLGAFSYRLRRDPAVPQPPGQPALPKPLTWRFRHEAQLLANGNGHPNQSPSLNQQE
jgi:hypothetical protein